MSRYFAKFRIFKILLVIVTFVILNRIALAESGSEDLNTILENLTSVLSPMAKLITAGAYLGGLGFAFAAIMKFKAHRDNPSQVPVGTPIAFLFIAIGLLFLPTLFEAVGVTVFGDGEGGSIEGTDAL